MKIERVVAQSARDAFASEFQADAKFSRAFGALDEIADDGDIDNCQHFAEWDEVGILNLFRHQFRVE